MKEFLEDSGYEVDCYTNSEEAYDAIYNKVYDLLLLDVKVPVENLLGKRGGGFRSRRK